MIILDHHEQIIKQERLNFSGILDYPHLGKLIPLFLLNLAGDELKLAAIAGFDDLNVGTSFPSQRILAHSCLPSEGSSLYLLAKLYTSEQLEWVSSSSQPPGQTEIFLPTDY